MDIFSTHVLTKVVENLKTPPSFLLDMFFSQELRSDTEEIYFDTQESKPRISPFVSPLMPGKVVEHEGYQTKSFKPAYVKDKRRFTPDMPFKRMAGERIGGELTPAQRLEKAVAVTLSNQLDCLTRREEVMASEVLRTGKITVAGDGYPSVTVDFGRDASFTKVLAGENTWNKESVCDCPLCHSKNFMMIGKFSIDAIIDTWVKHINFNPIADIYRHSYLEKRRCLNCGLYFYNYHLPDSELLYETLENQPKGYYTQFRAEYGSASEYINKLKPKSLIELGAGTGNFIDRIKNMVPEILASEYNKEAIRICLQKNIEATSIDVAKIQRKFDVVCAFEVLEHVWDNETFMQNCINLLHKKGKIIFSTPDPEGILAINGNGYLNLPPHHQFDFSYQTFEFLAQKYNLKIVEYKKSELQYRNYARYVENITGMPLTEPDIIGFLETKKQFSGHSHFVIFEKK